jgi:RNA polymerase sigma-70 factor (ECF subfamily)
MEFNFVYVSLYIPHWSVTKEKFNDTTDSELLEKFYSDRNNDWLGILLQRYTLLLLGVCMKYLKNEEDAKDAVQQIFLKAINELNKYKVSYFKSWIYMIAKNYCLMKLRDKGKTHLEINDHAITADEPVEIDVLLEKDDLLNKMNEVLKQLNKEQQQCLTLFYLEKKSYTEVASITGYHIMSVKSHIQNGKRNLRLLMKKKIQHNNSTLNE